MDRGPAATRAVAGQFCTADSHSEVARSDALSSQPGVRDQPHCQRARPNIHAPANVMQLFPPLPHRGGQFGTIPSMVVPPTSPYGAFFRSAASGRLIQLIIRLTFGASAITATDGELRLF